MSARRISLRSRCRSKVCRFLFSWCLGMWVLAVWLEQTCSGRSWSLSGEWGRAERGKSLRDDGFTALQLTLPNYHDHVTEVPQLRRNAVISLLVPSKLRQPEVTIVRGDC